MLRQRKELLELHSGVFQSLRAAVTQVTHDSESALIELALTAAQKVVLEVPIGREIVEANIRSALAQVEEATEFFIQLHPDDLALLQQYGSDLLPSASQAGKMHLAAAPEIGRGGCLVRTQFGILDARRETRMERMRQSLAL